MLNFQQITMPYLGARVPSGWQVRHVDEEAEQIDTELMGTFHWQSGPDVSCKLRHVQRGTKLCGRDYKSRPALVLRGRGLLVC